MTASQVEQHEQLMNEFDKKYTELKNHCSEMQHNFFRAVEEHEEGYFNSLTQLAQVSRRSLRNIYETRGQGHFASTAAVPLTGILFLYHLITPMPSMLAE